MTSTAAAAKKSEVLNDAVLARAATAKKQTTKATADAFANIEENTFAKIIFSPDLNPTQKKEAIEKALTFAGTKEENRERVREFEEIKEYLQHNRSEMAQQIIKLTDTEAFAELKLIYDQINGALVDFDNKMAPLTDIIDAVYKLRTSGNAINAFKEIQADRRREKEVADKRQEFERQVNDLGQSIEALNHQVFEESQKKTFFLGKIKPEAQQKIDAAEALIKEKTTALLSVHEDVEKLNAENAEITNRVGDYDQEKAKLRELLDISTDEHRHRQEELVAAALNFVDTAKDRIGAVRDHLNKMNAQVENLGDANSDMTQIYAILNEGIKGAGRANHEIRKELDAPADASNEDLITKMTREERLSGLDSHIKLLDNSAADTMMSYGDLTTQTIRIKAMKDSNEEQIAQARAMHTQGVAGVADRLSVVLQAVSSAAINESSSMAKETLGAMAENTNRIAQKEVIRVATGLSENNKDIERAIADLASYGEVRRVASELTRTSVAEMRESLQRMEETAKDVQGSIRESLSIHSDTETGDAPKSGAEKKASGLKIPFGTLGNG